MSEISLNEHNFPEFGSSTIPGYYTKKEDAFYVVKNNVCDIWETCYDYALIEKVKEGLYNPATNENRWWFKYNYKTEEYEQIEEPKGFSMFCGLTF